MFINFSRYIRSFILTSCLCLIYTTLLGSNNLWEPGQSDLPSHPKVHWGKLENGIHYAIMPHDEPPGRVSMRLLIKAGSLMEDEDQQGLAHLIEHMAFQGSTHFDTGKLVEYLQTIGMSFGADTNAFTSFNQTVYKLELPQVTPEYLKDGFTVLSDYAHGVLFNPEVLVTERGVVMSEKRDSDTVGYRIYKQFWQFMLDGTRLPTRFPIGVADVIENTPESVLLIFTNNGILLIAPTLS